MFSSYYTKSRVSGILVLCFVLAFVSSATFPVGFGQSKATLSGVITDAFGRTISDTLLTLYSPNRVLQTRSDKSGQFEFTNLRSDTYDLETSQPAFKNKRLEAIRVADEIRKPLSIVLEIGGMIGCDIGDSVTYERDMAQSGRRLEGVVLGANRRPLPRVKIQLVRVGTQVQVLQPSNSRGEFVFSNLEPGWYTLKLSRAGYHDRPTENFWIARENQTRIRVAMLKLGLMIACE